MAEWYVFILWVISLCFPDGRRVFPSFLSHLCNWCLLTRAASDPYYGISEKTVHHVPLAKFKLVKPIRLKMLTTTTLYDIYMARLA